MSDKSLQDYGTHPTPAQYFDPREYFDDELKARGMELVELQRFSFQKSGRSAWLRFAIGGTQPMR